MPGIPTPISVVTGGINPVKTVLTIVGIGIGGYAVYELHNWYKDVKAKGDLKKDQASTIKPAKGKVLKNLNGKPITGANLSTIVVDLDKALNFPTDQDMAIRVFKGIPWGYVHEVEKMYLDKYNTNLKQRMADKLSDVNFIKVKYYFE